MVVCIFFISCCENNYDNFNVTFVMRLKFAEAASNIKTFRFALVLNVVAA